MKRKLAALGTLLAAMKVQQLCAYQDICDVDRQDIVRAGVEIDYWI